MLAAVAILAALCVVLFGAVLAERQFARDYVRLYFAQCERADRLTAELAREMAATDALRRRDAARERELQRRLVPIAHVSIFGAITPPGEA